MAITEPYVGSDVASLKTTAKLTPDGKHYIVNGVKKWITTGKKSLLFIALISFYIVFEIYVIFINNNGEQNISVK